MKRLTEEQAQQYRMIAVEAKASIEEGTFFLPNHSPNLTMIESMVDEMDLSPNAFRLYFHIRKCAQEQTQYNPIKYCRLLAHEEQRCLQELEHAGLITRNPLAIINIFGKNLVYWQKANDELEQEIMEVITQELSNG